jgi:hypothetical protein
VMCDGDASVEPGSRRASRDRPLDLTRVIGSPLALDESRRAQLRAKLGARSQGDGHPRERVVTRRHRHAGLANVLTSGSWTPGDRAIDAARRDAVFASFATQIPLGRIGDAAEIAAVVSSV